MDIIPSISYLIVILLPIAILLNLLRKKTKPLSISDKAVLISGCDSGIGLRVAQHLSSLGFRVFACCLDSQKSQGARLLSRDKASGRQIHLLQLDVTKQHSISSAVQVIQSILSLYKTKGQGRENTLV